MCILSALSTEFIAFHPKGFPKTLASTFKWPPLTCDRRGWLLARLTLPRPFTEMASIVVATGGKRHCGVLAETAISLPLARKPITALHAPSIPPPATLSLRPMTNQAQIFPSTYNAADSLPELLYRHQGLNSRKPQYMPL
ncbi:hypothetical protein JTB14_027763 [Gonioctena quinquepunctata]|nr:hypothetical protein JTB14_027763 [Gonioctena quinquepunctata]